jgi:hypothetical protein
MNLGPWEINRPPPPSAPLPIQALYVGRSAATFVSLNTVRAGHALNPGTVSLRMQ